MKKSILVYRGDNPLMKNLEAELGNEFTETISVDIDDEIASGAYQEGKGYQYSAREAYMKGLSEKYDLVFTDNSLHVRGLDNVKSVYGLINENWLDRIKNLVQFFREQGKEPVINPYGLSHHFHKSDGIVNNLEEIVGSEKIQQLRDKAKCSTDDSATEEHLYIAELIGEALGVKTIPYDDPRKGGFSMHKDPYDRTTGVVGKLTEAIKRIDVDSSNTVVLVDHHVYELKKENQVENSEFNQVPIYPICKCCSGLKLEYLDALKELGFDVAEGVIDKAYVPQITEKIQDMIR